MSLRASARSLFVLSLFWCFSARVAASAGAVEPAVRWAADSPPPADDWVVAYKPAIVDDELLGRPVTAAIARRPWSIRSTTELTGSYAVEALVRLDSMEPTPGGLAILRVGVVARGVKSSPAYSLSVSRTGPRSHSISPTVGEGSLWTQPLLDNVSILDAKPTRWQLNGGERFPLAKISPLWDEQFRRAIEQDMLAMPDERQRWRRLRIEVRTDRVRMYHDGLLAFDEPRGARTDGAVALELTGPARVAELRSAPLEELDPQFEPLVLDDLCNAAGCVAADSLPPAGSTTRVGDVPLLFPRRSADRDHVDVGRSEFRYRRSTDADAGDPNSMWPTIGLWDPVRLRVRAPRGAYRKLWVLAACDDRPNSTPSFTARFYKPRKGWAIDAAADVPSLTGVAAATQTRRLAVRRPDGSPGSLWLVGVDLDAAAQSHELRDEPVYHLELTRQVLGFRAFPDPMYYGFFPGGLPSAVRVFAMTLERAPLEFNAHGARPGNTFAHPERPSWQVDVSNASRETRTARVTLLVTSPAGRTQTLGETLAVEPGRKQRIELRPDVAEFGLFQVRTTVTVGEYSQSRDGRFVALPPDTRRATAANTRFGLWYWNKAHGTHDVPAESMQLFRAYGSYVAGHAKLEDRAPWKLASTPHLAFRTTPAWAFQDPYDPAEYAKYSEECGQYVVKQLQKEPDLQYVSIFAEHSISLRVTHGNPPWAHGDPWYDYTPEERRSIRAHFLAAKAAFEGVRRHAPQVKFLFGHCGPLFSLPFMRDGYPKELFDGYGVDSPQFERMAERPPRAVEPNHMYFLNAEMKRLGYDKELVHVESYYPPTHPMALSLRESADSIVRTAVLSLANGTDRFLACWTLDDPEGAWGSQHYGSVGILERRPEMNPKPGATAYATMTTMLDTAKYAGYVPTGSRSAYCVRFQEPTRQVYALWTIRGSRPIVVTLKATKAPVEATLTDEHGNQRRLAPSDGRLTIELTPTPVWLTIGGTSIETAEVGAPSYASNATPTPHRRTLLDFETETLAFTGEADPRYATNSWDMRRERAPYKVEQTASAERGSRVLRVTCEAPKGEPNVTGRYGVLAPSQPLPIPGKARAIGLWARGNSGWGRVVFEIVDAKGERFQSIGMKDQWNCDDTHSWSYFNFDGWRRMEFPLPGNAPGDDYREPDSVWWNHSAEGIVDLPVSLTKLIVEMPTHQIYVDELLPVASSTVELDDLTAIYADEANMTDLPVRTQRAAAGLSNRPAGATDRLPNPIADLRTTGVGAPTKIERFYAPEQFNDGTRIHAAIAPVAAAKEYQVWVSAYADGRGAMPLMKSATPEPLVTRLRPGVPLHFFVTYVDADGKTSRPSEGATITLKDEFLQK